MSAALARFDYPAARHHKPRTRNTVVVSQPKRKWLTARSTTLPVVDDVERKMHALDTAAPGELTSQTKKQVSSFLRAVTSKDTTYPSVAPDDEGVAVLHWVAGDFTVQVDVDETGPIYLWVRRGNNPASVVTGDSPRIKALARARLGEMAARVAAVNPHWRSAYRLT